MLLTKVVRVCACAAADTPSRPATDQEQPGRRTQPRTRTGGGAPAGTRRTRHEPALRRRREGRCRYGGGGPVNRQARSGEQRGRVRSGRRPGALRMRVAAPRPRASGHSRASHPPRTISGPFHLTGPEPAEGIVPRPTPKRLDNAIVDSPCSQIALPQHPQLLSTPLQTGPDDSRSGLSVLLEQVVADRGASSGAGLIGNRTPVERRAGLVTFDVSMADSPRSRCVPMTY